MLRLGTRAASHIAVLSLLSMAMALCAADVSHAVDTVAPRASSGSDGRVEFLKRELEWARKLPAAERRRLPPCILVMKGCSGSTFILASIIRILRKAGVPVASSPFELLHQDKNAFYHPAIGMHGALRIWHARAVRANQSLVFKAEPTLLLASAANKRAARELIGDLGARIVLVWRKNSLDRLVSSRTLHRSGAIRCSCGQNDCAPKPPPATFLRHRCATLSTASLRALATPSTRTPARGRSSASRGGPRGLSSPGIRRSVLPRRLSPISTHRA